MKARRRELTRQELAERAFAVLDALGTVVLFDELEKTIGHGDNDGGVSRRNV